MANPGLIAILVVGAVGLFLFYKKTAPSAGVPDRRDNRITSSAFGEPIPLGYGTVRLFGNIIWATEINEVAGSSGGGKKGGGGSQSQYYASFAVAFSDRQAKELIGIYADGVLIYGNRDPDVPNVERMPELKFRFYRGTPTQNPDPLIQRYQGDDIPAFRGTCYIVFENFPLTQFGGRAPNISAVISFVDNTGGSGVTTRLDDSIFGAGSILFTDTQRDVIFYQGLDPDDSTYYLGGLDPSDGSIIYRRDLPGVWAEAGLSNFQDAESLRGAFGPYLVFSRQDFSAHMQHLVVSKRDFKVLYSLGQYNPSLSSIPPTRSPLGIHGGPGTVFPVFAIDGSIRWIAVGTDAGFPARTTGYLWALEIDENGHEFLWGDQESYDGGMLGAFFGNVSEEGTELFFVHRDNAHRNQDARWIIRKLFFAVAGNIIGSELVFHSPVGIEIEGGSYGRFAYKDSDRAIFFDTGGKAGAIHIDSGTLLFSRNVTSVEGNKDQSANRIEGGGFPVFLDTDGQREITYLDSDGSVFLKIDGGNDYANDVLHPYSRLITDSVNGRFIGQSDTYGSNRRTIFYQGGVFGGSENLADVVTDIVTKGPLSSEQIDVSDLQGETVKGFVVGRDSSIREMLQSLAVAYEFDGAEIGDKLVFKRRSTTVDFSISEQNLVRSADGPLVTETRTQAAEKPISVTVTSMDRKADFNSSAQTRRLITSGQKVAENSDEVKIDLPVVQSDQERVEVADRLLAAPWLESESLSFRLPPTYMDIVPTDVISINALGVTRTMRIQEAAHGGDRTVEVTAYLIDPDYVSSVDAGGLDRSAQGGGLLRYFTPFSILIDGPYLRDVDSSGLSVGGLYIGASRGIFSAGPFHLVSFFEKPESQNFTVRGALSYETPWGTAVTTMPDIPSEEFNGLQKASVDVEVIRRSDLFSGMSKEQFFQDPDSNVAAILKPDGEVEYFRFQEVTDLGGNVLRLSNLVRGQRGTETMASGYSGGETIVLLGFTWIDKISVDPTRAGSSLSYTSVPNGTPADDGDLLTQTLSVRSLMPYAPVQVTASESSGDITIEWVRRTRIGGALTNGTGTVPLSEDSESYEIDVLNGSGGSVLRTLSSSSTSVVYTAAQQTTDFGGAVSGDLHLRVYQISAEVGRGFSKESVVNI